MTAQVTCWHPVNTDAKVGDLDDIAVLELASERPVPNAARPVPVVVVEDPAFFDRPVRMYGFAEDRGDWVSGQLQGPVATGWVQLDHALGRLCVAPGFSGTAVWDKRENAAVGMIVSIATRENVRSAYMIPAASLIRAWPTLDAHSRPPNPYRGLEAFREQDARYFMGRDRDIQDVLALLRQRPFVAVVGASGSGKSSLLFAGVVPQLRQQEDWRIADFRPRGDPFWELAKALTPLLYPDLNKLERLKYEEQLASNLNKRELSLTKVVDLLLRENPDKRLLLIIDQFEELYTQNLTPERRRQFVDELVAAVRAQGKKPAFTLLLAMRVDFLGQALDYEPLAEWIKPNHLLLGPLSQAGLEAAIESPARQLGVKLEDGLAERILQNLGQEPGALPLLEFALTQLWERQQYRQLTHVAYKAIGGVTQALARHADETLARFQGEQERLRRVFVQLVRPGEGTEDTRQVATREQVGAENWNLVTELADERLVVTGRDAQGQETVEVVHEALLRHWQPLRRWIEQDRQFRLWQNRLRLGIQEWQEKGHDEGALLRGTRLAEAEERLNDHAKQLSQAEKDYIKASITLRERETAIRQRTRRRVITGLVVGLVVALALSGLATWQWWEAEQQRNNARSAELLANKQRDEADRQRNLALARQLAIQAALRLDNTGEGLVQSALLVTESLQRDPTPSAYVTWGRTMDLLSRHQPIRLPHENRMSSMVFSSDGQRLAAASEDNNIVRVWEIVSSRELAQFSHEGRVRSIAFSPDARRLAVVSEDNTVRLWEVASGQKQAQLFHKNQIEAMVFSPNSQWLATTSSDNIVRVWEVVSGRILARLPHEKQVESISFSSNGQRLVTASENEIARVWEVASGRELAQLSHNGMVADVMFSPDGQRLATAGGQTAQLLDTNSSKELARLPHQAVVLNVMFSPDGQRLVTASLDNTARVWDAASGRELARLPHENQIKSIVFSPDSQRLATISSNHTARVWDAASGRELARLGTDAQVVGVAFSLDSKWLITVSQDNKMWKWEVDSDRELARLVSKENKAMIRRVVLSPDGQRLVIVSYNGVVRILEVPSGRELARLPDESSVNNVVFSPDGRRLATVSVDKIARVWEVSRGRELIQLPHKDEVLRMAFSPDGQRLATVSVDKIARVWEVSSGRELIQLPHKDEVLRMAFSPDGQRLATSEGESETAGENGVVRVWEIASGHKLAQLHHEDEVLSIIFSPNGRWLATGSEDETARVWQVASGRELARLNHEETVHDVVFSPDNQRLATASYSNTVQVWEIPSGWELFLLTHEDSVTSVVFSPDGQRLATASADKTARVWDAASGRELARLAHDDAVINVVFSPDGQRLITASEDNAARVWLWRAEDLIAEACRRLPRNLTHQEWRQYVGEEVPYHATCSNLPVPEN